MRRLVQAVLSGAVVGGVCLGLACTSYATGPCGSDLTQSTACPFTTSPQTLSGSIASTSEVDYFVFWARRNTHLSVTVNDVENPTCSLQPTVLCGGVTAHLVDNHGSGYGATSFSTPSSGVAGPESLSGTLHGGIWYLEVTGQPDTNGAAVPYTLSIDPTTHPAVAWPPLCVVPKVRAGVRLRRARARVKQTYCLPKVRRVYNRHYRRGRVVRLHPGTGAVEPYHAKISIVVSRGRRPRTHHHHRHR